MWCTHKLKKKKILLLAKIWVDFGDIMLNEISQVQRDKYCMISLICRI
jgi:hypothetical protein